MKMAELAAPYHGSEERTEFFGLPSAPIREAA
jgi:hypothetical protein